MATAVKPKLTASEYLAWENALSDVRHEFVEGEVFAMTGTTRQHNEVVMNLVMQLRPALKDTPCRVFAVDIKVRVEAANAYFYPDLVITCNAKDLDVNGPAVLTEPSVIIEVSSPSTADYDLAGKFARYRMLPSLKEYIIVAPLSHGATVFRKQENGHWEVISDMTHLTVQSMDFTCPLADVFANVAYVAPELRE
ncbi:MAG: Uma2 family endonuclease [Casimicrobium sp.]